MQNIIKDWLAKDKGQAVATLLIIFLVGGLSFGLGRLSKIEDYRQPVRFEPAELSTTSNFLSQQSSGLKGGGETDPAAAGQFVASRNSDKYHLPWCAGAQRIKPENKIWFATRAEAEKAGYQPAGNCPGL